MQSLLHWLLATTGYRVKQVFSHNTQAHTQSFEKGCEFLRKLPFWGLNWEVSQKLHDFEIICPKRGCERIPRTPSAYGPELHFRTCYLFITTEFNGSFHWLEVTRISPDESRHEKNKLFLYMRKTKTQTSLRIHAV